MTCLICKSNNWPVVDYTTGFEFCDGCHRDIIKVFDEFKYKNSSNWLKSIAKIMDLYNT